MATDQPTAPATPRTIVVAITALDAGIVVVTPVNGDPRVLQGAEAAKLHALALDPTIEAGSIEKANAGGFAGRLLGIAERFVSDGGG
jgi:hypothetical protein